MQKTRTWKRVSAVMLTIAMLVGMLSVLGGLGFSASAAVSEELKFKADFSELTAIADEAAVTYTGGLYRPGITTDVDKEIDAWVKAKFRLVTGYGRNLQRDYLGQSLNHLQISLDRWSNDNFWYVTNDGSIRHQTNQSGQIFRLVESLVPQYEGKDAVLSNFEATLTFAELNTTWRSAIIIGFHEDTPAFYRNTGDYVMQSGTGSFVAFGNADGSGKRTATPGIAFYDKNNTLGTDGATVQASLCAIVPNTNTPEKEAADKHLANENVNGELLDQAITAHTRYALTVRVVGKSVTATLVNTETDEQLYTRTVEMEQAGSGYMSIGSSNSYHKFYSIEIQELDENGLPVPFGTETGADAVETFKADFTNLPGIQYTGGVYYYGTNHDTDVIPESYDATATSLTKGAVSYSIDTKDNLLVDYLTSKFRFYYAQESSKSGRYFRRENVNDYYKDADGNDIIESIKAGYAETESWPYISSGNVYTPDMGSTYDNATWVNGIGNSGAKYGVPTWSLYGNDWLTIYNQKIAGGTATGQDGEMYRNYNQMVVLDGDGNAASLKNFKLTMGFELKSLALANLAVTFRANTEAASQGFKDRAMFAISYTGGYILAGPNDTITKDDATTMTLAEHTAKSSTAVYPYAATTAPGTNACTLELTVIGDQMTAVVYDKNGNKIVDKTVTTKWLHEGFLTIGGSNDAAYYRDIEITRLDDNGNPVDFNNTGAGYEFGADFNNLVYLKTPSNTMVGESVAADAKYPYNSSDTGDPWYMSAKTTSTVTNSKVVDYLNSKFDFYGSFEGTFVEDVGADGIVTSGTATNKWGINYYAGYGSYLCATCSLTSKEMMRNSATMVPKDENGEPYFAKSVETTFDAFLPDHTLTSVQFSFRSDTPGRVIKGYNTNWGPKVAIVVNHRGVLFVDGAETHTRTDDDSAPYRQPFDNGNYDALTLADGTANDAEIYVRVHIKALGDTVSVKVTSLTDGTVLLDKTYATTWLESGYMGYTVFGNQSASFANINLRALAGNGDVISFDEVNDLTDRYAGDAYEVKYKSLVPYGTAAQAAAGIPKYLQTTDRYINYPGSGNTNYLSFAADGQHFAYKNRTVNVADGYSLVTEGDVTKIMKDGTVFASTEDYTVDAIAYTDETETVIKITSNNAEMNELVIGENGFLTQAKAYLAARLDAYYIDTKLYKGNSLLDNGWGAELNAIYGNKWLQFTGLAATVDKTADPVDNHMTVYVPKNPLSGKYIQAAEFDASWLIRLSGAGNFDTAYFVFNMSEPGNVGVAATSNAAIAFNSDLHAIKINKSQFMFWNGTEWVDLIADGGYTYKAETTLVVKVADGVLSGSIGSQTFEVALTNTNGGYFAIAQNSSNINFGELNIDTPGIPQYKIARANKTEGGKITVERAESDKADLYKYIVTATANEGWMLKANTLLGTDANGDTVYPAQRVGFQSDKTGGESYYFYTAEDITFDAEFYTAYDATQANVGNLGTSYNAEKYGLRFISRLYMTEDNGVKYTEIDGEKYEVVDYGMLLAATAGLEWGANNGHGNELTFNSTNPYISKKSAKNGPHYDISGKYVDVAVSVIGLEGKEDTELTARAYMVVKVGETEVVAYSDAFTSTFLKNVSLNMVTYLDPVNGNDANAGTIDAPVQTVAQAIKVTTREGTIVNKGDATLPGTFGTGNADAGITLTGGTYTMGSRHTTLNSPVTFADTKIVVPDFENTEVWFAAGHKLVIKDTVTMDGHFDSLYGGCDQSKDLERTDLELYAGNFHNIIGGSAAKYVAETHITVGGNVNADMKTTGENNHDVGIWGGGVKSADTGDTYITFGGNAYSYMIYGGSSQAGTISGDTHVTVTGGQCAQIFGGCDRVNMTGNTNVTVTGGEVTRRIYGGCYNEEDSQTFHVTGNTNVTIGAGLDFTMTGKSSGVDAWEGIRAGSRLATNAQDENSTLTFLNATAQSNNAGKLATSGDAKMPVLGTNYITMAFGSAVADTTDNTVVLG